MLLSARPFKVGERVRLQGGPIGGRLEGVVSSLGLLYTSLATGEDRILVPNSIVLSVAIVPLLEPDSVSLRARFPADVRPSAIQELLETGIDVPIRSQPDIDLQEMDGDEVVVRISATPQRSADGAHLADQMLAAIAALGPANGNAAPAPDPDARQPAPPPLDRK